MKISWKNAMAALSLGCLICAAGCSSANKNVPQQTRTASGLTIIELAEGHGTPAKAGDRVFVNYTGKLADGTTFDSSFDHNPPLPLPFTIGDHRVIAGWEEGITGMKVGGKRQLIIPPQLGYDDQPMPGIPANSTLYFDVELVSK